MSIVDVVITLENGGERTLRLPLPLIIGRDVQSHLRVSSWRVAKQHARISLSGKVLELEDLGSLRGTTVNGQRVSIHRPLHSDDEIVIGPCCIRVRLLSNETLAQDDDVVVEPRRIEIHELTAQYGSDAGRMMHDQTSTNMHPVVLPDESGLVSFRQRLHRGLKQALDLRRRDIADMSQATLREEAVSLLFELAVHDKDAPETVDRMSVCKEVIDEAIGLGPLEPLLSDPEISEIMVNRHDQIYIEKDGILRRHSAVFSSEEAVRRVIERVVNAVGRRIDESSPMVDARLSDGSRMNAVIPPVAVKGANITIRKFPSRMPSIADLIDHGALSVHMADFLLQCVRSRKNIVISGGAGSGKTTLLNILANGIPAGERIVSIEDSAELRLDHEHCVALEARPENLEYRGHIGIRDLLKNALRMRPDRIVVGECRGAEAFDMLNAMNTGHTGSLTTLHANSPRDALSRLEVMVLMAGLDLPLGVVREYIGSSVDIVVQQGRLADGVRVVESIAEVTGLESGRIQLQEIFKFDKQDGFRGCGVVPDCIENWVAHDIRFDLGAFSQTTHYVAGRDQHVL